MSKSTGNTRKFEINTAILIDGGFYRKRAKLLFGSKSPRDRADELFQYCLYHLKDDYEHRHLYRIFYYDCEPIDKNAFHPLTGKSVNLGKSPEYAWAKSFYDELRHRRKFALRMGKINDSQVYYNLKFEATKKLFSEKITLNDLTENDFQINLEQKGVDL